MVIVSRSQWLGCALMIAGTAIGAGILALPLEAAPFGLWPTAMWFVAVWAMMGSSGWIWWYVSRPLAPQTHLAGMTAHYMGTALSRLAMLVYVSLLISLCAAYLSGLGDMMHLTMASHHLALSTWSWACVIAIITWGLLVKQAQWTDHINRFLMLMFVTCYGYLIFHLHHRFPIGSLSAQFGHSWSMLPVVITSFGYHIMIPTLRLYTQDHPGLGRLIVISSLIPLAAYLMWVLVIFQIIPSQGPWGLVALSQRPDPVNQLTQVLAERFPYQALSTWMHAFAMTAMITSFMGVSRGLFDHLKDWGPSNHHALSAMTLLPPLAFLWLKPHGFMIALRYAGLCVAFLLVLLPSTMLIMGRQQGRLNPSWMTCSIAWVNVICSLGVMFSMA